MLNVTKELTALARKLGYTGKAPDTVAKAINAITSVASEGGDYDPGYEMAKTQLFSEVVTTSVDPEYPDDPAFGSFAYLTQITADTVVVTFDGTDYICNKIYWGGSNAYGGLVENTIDLSSIPFLIVSDTNPSKNEIYTATGGTHTVSVASANIETSEQFQEAVNSVLVDLEIRFNSVRLVDGAIINYGSYESCINKLLQGKSINVKADFLDLASPTVAYKEYGVLHVEADNNYNNSIDITIIDTGNLNTRYSVTVTESNEITVTALS